MCLSGLTDKEWHLLNSLIGQHGPPGSIRAGGLGSTSCELERSVAQPDKSCRLWTNCERKLAPSLQLFQLPSLTLLLINIINIINRF